MVINKEQEKKNKYKTERQIWNLLNREIRRLKTRRDKHLESDNFRNIEGALLCENYVSAYERLKGLIRPKRTSFWNKFYGEYDGTS